MKQIQINFRMINLLILIMMVDQQELYYLIRQLILITWQISLAIFSITMFIRFSLISIIISNL